MQRIRVLTTLPAAALATFPLTSEGQKRQVLSAGGDVDSLVTVVPAPEYRAGPLARVLLGSGWREVWLTPVDAPTLDLGRFAGGLKLLERGGGMQSVTIHLGEEKGWRKYLFRSVNKFPMQGMPPAVKGTAAGAILQDQVSTLFPAAPLLVSPLLEAIHALHVKPTLYRMPDDKKLGIYRDTVAGMLGTMELKGAEAPNDEPGFAGSRKIKGTTGFLDDLNDSRAHRLAEEEFLAVRLIDFLVNDSDRTPDNFDWARFGNSGGYSWRPVSRDRDRAFMDARGWLNRLVIRPAYPKIVEFGPTYSYKGLTYTSHALDRRLLQRLTRQDFAQITLRVRAAITDDVIEEVIAAMPASWREQTAAPDRLRSALRARRNALPAIAEQFYLDLASDVDIHGTDEPERAEVERHGDGSVTVTLTGRDEVDIAADSYSDAGSLSRATAMERSRERNGPAASRAPFYRRSFSPAETKELRLHLRGGADHAVVRGAASGAIVVRIIGGRGDDVLADSAGGGATYLYDAEGNNRFVTSRDTPLNVRKWTPPAPANGLRLGRPWRPDWGGGAGWSPALDYDEGAGVIVGFGPDVRSYGFRRLPHHWAAGAKLLVGTGNGRVAVTANGDYRAENSPLAFIVDARASQLDPLRFHGFGNNTPAVSRDLSFVDQTVLAFEPALVWHIGWRAREGTDDLMRDDAPRDTAAVPRFRPMEGRFRAGPVLYWIDPHARANSPLAVTTAPGGTAFGHMGIHVGLELDRTDRAPIPMKGWRLKADVNAFPPLWGLSEAFTTSRAVGTVYVPLIANGPHLAVRAGAAVASGEFPVQYAPAIGGWSTLRGYSWSRYTGDASLDGSTELRVPVGTVNLFLRWDVGVFGLADLARVWFDERSDDGWHAGFGGGFWLSALGKSVSVAYAHGQAHRFYLRTGLF
jgi:hypothetical protein